MHDFIDLGVSPKDKESIMSESHYDKPSFPCLYITSDEAIEFGDVGTATVKYKVVEHAEKNREGVTEHRYELEIHGIKPEETEEMDEGMDEMPMNPKPKRGLSQNFGEMLDKARKSRYSEEA